MAAKKATKDTASDSAEVGDLSTVEGYMAKLQKRFGDVVKHPEDTPMTPTFIPTLDIALGGGAAQGRVIEYYGPPSSGKTSLALHNLAVKQWMCPDKLVGLIDAEHSFDPSWATTLGIDMERFLLLQPDTAEDIMNILIEGMGVDKEIGGVVVDSIAAMVTKAQVEKTIGENTMGSKAKVLSEGLAKLTAKMLPTGPFIVFLNQLRMKLNVSYGSPETTTGGEAMKFYASQRLDIRRADVDDVADGDNPEFNHIRVKIVKNKVAPPFRKVDPKSLAINYDEGFRLALSFFHLYGIYNPKSKGGAGWFTIPTTNGDKKFQGAEALEKAFWTDHEMREAVIRNVVANVLEQENKVKMDLDLYLRYYEYQTKRREVKA